MPTPGSNLYERYAPIRRPVEAGFWVLLIALQAGFGTAVALVDARAAAHPPPAWQVATWELSSHLALLVLVPGLAAFERRHPLYRPRALWRTLGWHLVGSVAFSLAHVALMLALRQAVFAVAGERYAFGGAGAWGYEYLKDVRTYAMMVAGIAAYRLWLLRLQGEARELDPPEAPAEPQPPSAEAPPGLPERFLVRKLRREFLIAASDIDWVQAQGNYVGLRVNGHDYLLRATLTEFMARLDPRRFVRVHRSHAVNLDRVREIEPTDGGDARLHLRDGSVVPCSRRYRDALGARAG